MAYSVVELWNGSNRVGVDSNGSMSVAINPTSTIPTLTAIAIGSSNTSVLSANVARKGLVLENDGVNNIYINFGVSANINQGLRINANGGIFDFSNMVPRTAVYAISIGATSNLLVMEG